MKKIAMSEDFIGQRTWTNYALWWGADLEPVEKGNRNIMFAQYYGLKKIHTVENPAWRTD